MEANGKKVNATLYQIDGLDFSPTYLWLDEQHNAFAAVQGWSGLIRAGLREHVRRRLSKRRMKFESARAASLAKQLIHHPAGDLVIKNVTVFDSATAKTVPAQRVTVRGERIVSVEAEQRPADRRPARRSSTAAARCCFPACGTCTSTSRPTTRFSTSPPASRPFAIWATPLTNSAS